MKRPVGHGGSRLRAYLIAMGIGAVCVVLNAWGAEYTRNSIYLIPTLGTLASILAVGGFGPAALGSAISLAGTAYYQLEPVRSLAVHDPADQFKLLLATGCVVFACWFDARSRQERARASDNDQALRDSESRYRTLVERSTDAIILLSRDGRIELANGRAAQLLRRDPASLTRGHVSEVFEDSPETLALLAREGNRLPAEVSLTRGDGTRILIDVAVQTLPNGLTELSLRDMANQRRAAHEIREERDLLDGILETTNSSILAVEWPSRRVVFANQHFLDLVGATRDDLNTNGPHFPWEYTSPDGTPLAQHEAAPERALTLGTVVRDEMVRVRRAAGGWQDLLVNAAPLLEGDGSTRAMVLSFDDVTARGAAERALHESQTTLLGLSDTIPGTIFQFRQSRDGSQSISFLNQEVSDTIGLTGDNGWVDFAQVARLLAPEDRSRLESSIRSSAASLKQWNEELRVALPTGDRRWFRGTATPVALTDGTVLWNGLFLDVTDHKRLEGDLLHTQKMESIGRLAGGVAHDFNNILTAIRGNVDLLLEDLHEGAPTFAELRDIRDAAERATSLTRQLLAFSRKQALQTRELELGSLVRDMEKMLRRVIGEDVVLLTQPAEGLGLVRADPGQVEQVILNLAVNARDAMPEGGLLTIETRNVRLDPSGAATMGITAGDYVSLVVRDTGHGMDEETKARIFDPYFTTKPKGKGTGLGLAMVYGIVNQSGGAIAVDSAPGRGATFRIFFPRVWVAQDRLTPTTPQSVPALRTRREANILLVEDDTAVRSLTLRMLRDAGFQVRAAPDAYDALTIAGPDCDGIDLLVTDVIMPGMGGRDLVRELRSRRSDLKILYMSGYLDIDVPRLGLDRRTRLLAKPFTRDALLQQIDQLLDVPAPARR